MYEANRQQKKDEALPNFYTLLKDGVDKLNPHDWDYIVSDFAAVAIMYYIVREWKTDKIMLNVSPLGSLLGAPPPWPSPNMLTGLQENMSSRERLFNTVTGILLNVLFLPLLTLRWGVEW